MSYKAITDKTSKQYKLLNSGILKNNNGLLTTDDGYVAVALGSRFGGIGDRFVITFDNGKSFKAIKVDEKADKDTSNKCHHVSDGSLIEFVIDTKLSRQSYPLAIKMGNFNYVDQFHGNVVKIEKEI